jgi:bifunctional UDP-N-acetylglucosamine pyrophosphorylase / glucosamine-1-phosphate N-acetyltransferase
MANTSPKIPPFIHPSSYVDATVTLGEGVHVAAFCVIETHVTIGAGSHVAPFSHIATGVSIGSNVHIHSSYIEADVQIGDECSIGPYAHLRTGTVLENHVRIGNFVETKQAHFSEGSKAPHLAYVGDAHLGKEVNFAAGAITANYNPLTKEKHRTTIDDYASVGANSVLVAPIHLGESAFVAAGSTLTKPVPPYALAVGRGKQVMKEGWVPSRRHPSSTHPSSTSHNS